MKPFPKSTAERFARLERELVVWRLIGLSALVCLTLALSSAQTTKEIRFSSDDGKQVVVLSSDGLSLTNKGKTLARLSFENVGESDELEAAMKLTGGLSVGPEGILIQDGKDRAIIHANGAGFLQGPSRRASLSFDGLELADPPGITRITISTPQQGLGGLTFLHRQNIILSLGALGNFRDANAPRRDVGAILMNEMGPDPKSRLITPTESELHTTHPDSAKQ